jgi:integrase
LPLVAHFSAPRFNAVVSALKKIFPAQGRFLRLRRVTVKERAPLSQLQFSRLLAELDERPQSHGGLVIRFLAYTGLRINEARQLRWSDVRRDCIVLPGKFSKNGRPRHVPFVPGLGDVLDALRRVSGAELVLPQGEVKRALQTACRLAGVPRLSHHDFRHLFATRCIESGVDMPTAARWLGHQDGGALLGRVYFHLADRHSREMAARVSI